MIFTTKQKRRIRKAFARGRFAGPRDVLADRAYFAEYMKLCTEDGKIAVCRTGHDCDHMHYTSVTIVPTPGVFAFLKAEDKHRESLDGPETVWIARPSSVEEGYSCRDVAAEMAGY